MKRRWCRLLPVLLLILSLCASFVPAGGSSPVYLMSVNDTVKPLLTVDNMPLLFNGVLYVPYTMLSKQETGIDLGVNAQYNSNQSILSVSNGSRTVNFNTKKNTAHASTGEVIQVRAVMRNSMAFLPVEWLCNYFTSLKYSLTQTSYGTLVRLTNRAVVLDDREFVDAADTLFRNALQSYRNSLAAPSPSSSVSPSPSVSLSPSTSPSPSVSPSPSTSPSPSVSPSVSVPPSPSPTGSTAAPSPSQSQTPEPAPLVCLAFKWGTHTAEVADVLDSAGQCALFLFPVNVLAREDDLVRRLVGQGHQVGLILEGKDGEDCLAQLIRGRQLVADIARAPVLIVAADDLGRAGLAALRDAGCAVWSATLRADGMTGSGVLLRLDSKKGNYAEITCDTAGAKLTAELLPRLMGENYRLRLASAPAL